ncbi:DUF2304 domain-containing protein [Thermosulfurimonas dismutans]|uniref:DUF2304 domain-containing protein n=1 Tax=Thermosulfurimonas dismutans TaxID=999894 RepID=A0A179D4W0_9BACT|nr:DUF2304 domain-containing protein [Thermosulfurimonas dismutans]OAQ21130.1 hypothetical protein TDIS_0782 [Thermosulfurimonas dismutans]
MTVNLLIITLAIGTSLVIFFLVRKNLIYLSYSLFWLSMAVIILVLGIFPQLNIWLASRLGVEYYPILPVTMAILLLFVKSLTQDIELTKKEKKIRRLIQELSILKKKEKVEDY